MPCDYQYNIDAQKEEERRKAEEERKRREAQQKALETQLGSGIAKIEKNPVTGQFRIVGGNLPEGMHDSCVLATLQKRGSFAFRSAMAGVSTAVVDFVSVHDKSHGN